MKITETTYPQTDTYWRRSPTLAARPIKSPDQIFRHNPIHKACIDRDYNRVKSLLGQGAQVNSLNENNQSPLRIACLLQDLDLVELLLKHRACIDDLLCIAVLLNNANLVQLLLNYGAEVEKTNHKGASLLEIARQYQHLEILDLLISHIEEKRNKQPFIPIQSTKKKLSFPLKHLSARV